MKYLLLFLLLCSCSKDYEYTSKDFQRCVVISFIAIPGINTSYLTHVKSFKDGKTYLVTNEPRFVVGDTVFLYDKNIGRSKFSSYFEEYRWGLAQLSR
jgi:hypothetical protein